jgi:hypothetical protein
VRLRRRIEDLIRRWPVYQQITGTDGLGRGAAAKIRASGRLARWGIFRAGLACIFRAGLAYAADPKHTVVRQRDRLRARQQDGS